MWIGKLKEPEGMVNDNCRRLWPSLGHQDQNRKGSFTTFIKRKRRRCHGVAWSSRWDLIGGTQRPETSPCSWYVGISWGDFQPCPKGQEMLRTLWCDCCNLRRHREGDAYHPRRHWLADGGISEGNDVVGAKRQEKHWPQREALKSSFYPLTSNFLPVLPIGRTCLEAAAMTSWGTSTHVAGPSENV